MAAALVQEAVAFDAAPAFGSNVTLGNVILVAQLTNEYTGEPGAPSKDSGSATIGSFTKINGAPNTGVGGISLYWAEVTGTGSLTLATNGWHQNITEWSGLNTADLVEDSDVTTQSGTTLTSPALTTAAETLVVGFFGKHGQGWPGITQPSGYTALGGTNWFFGGYDVDVASGTPTPAWTLDASRDVSLITAALNIAGLGGSDVEISGSTTITFAQSATLRDGAATGRRVQPGGWSFYPAQGAS